MLEDFTSDSDKECRIGGYILLSTIGKGSFAKVMLARHILTGTEVAVKIVNRQGSFVGYREFHCLQHLNHPNIAKLFEVIATDDHYFLFMEHLSGGELFDYLEKYGARTEEEARTLFRQLLSALHYCHEKGFVHRDLKPENILLDAEHNIKLADFGFGKQFYNNKLTSFCGTLWYMAPEILRSESYDGPKVDIWSLGVILYQIVTGGLPFDGEDYGEVKRRVLRGHFHLPNFISEECQNLLKKIITLDPTQRPTLDAIIKDPWVNKGQKEKVKLYRDPPCGDIDPQITEKMKHLGYNQEEIRKSVMENTYNNIMGTYLILQTTKVKIKGHTVRVRPCSFPAERQHHCTTTELWAVDRKTNRPTSPPTKVAERVAVPATSMAPRVTVPTNSVAHTMAIPSASTQADEAITTTSGHMELAVPSSSTQADETMTTTSGDMELAVPSSSTQADETITTTTGDMELAVLSSSTQADETITTTSGDMELAVPSASTETELVIATTSGHMELAVPSSSTQADETITTTSGYMELAVPSASTETELVIATTTGHMELAVPFSSTQGDETITTTTGHMELAVPSSSTQGDETITTTTGHMELAVSSSSTQAEVPIPTTSLEPRVDVSTSSGGVGVAVTSESVKSRTLSCSESRAATPSPAFHHSSLGSFPTASPALQNGSSGSLTAPGSRKSSTSSSSSSSQGSSTHHSEGRQQGASRVLQFFLKVFCCGPSPSMDKKQKKTKVHPRFYMKFWRAKIGPQ